ncbi:hypothetical protein OH76DRAFT_1225062 [Lentinus brumalis]|uniref:Uncharacterized protein n=1 Tax=Lentinus brumalis TaxID=2498619 RepID=A0A371DLT5_9APHY|nr:hypothetical protein OH76DRAFT_1225062 [Polyporus brumalis]
MVSLIWNVERSRFVLTCCSDNTLHLLRPTLSALATPLLHATHTTHTIPTPPLRLGCPSLSSHLVPPPPPSSISHVSPTPSRSTSSRIVRAIAFVFRVLSRVMVHSHVAVVVVYALRGPSCWLYHFPSSASLRNFTHNFQASSIAFAL